MGWAETHRDATDSSFFAALSGGTNVWSTHAEKSDMERSGKYPTEDDEDLSGNQPELEIQEVDWTEVCPLIVELKQLLSTRNLRARKVAEAIDAQLARTIKNADFQAVLGLVRQLDFDKADNSLAALLDQGVFPSANSA